MECEHKKKKKIMNGNNLLQRPGKGLEKAIYKAIFRAKRPFKIRLSKFLPENESQNFKSINWTRYSNGPFETNLKVLFKHFQLIDIYFLIYSFPILFYTFSSSISGNKENMFWGFLIKMHF